MPREPPAPDARAAAGTRAEPITAPTGAPLVESSEPATLTVVTRPWAEVFVDGQSRGYTPRVREVRLSPGTHRLRFANPLCEPVEEVIHVSAGETVSREFALQVRLAEVSISAPRGPNLHRRQGGRRGAPERTREARTWRTCALRPGPPG
ncbi:PEGA domain-containing protein [Pyxidicoccus sp. 3LG]